MKYTAKTIVTIVSAGLLWLIWWLALPTLSLGFLSGFTFIAIILIAIVANICMWVSNFNNDRYVIKPIIIVGSVAVVIILGGVIISTPLFQSSSMRNQIGTVETFEYNEMIE